ncbi:MAG: hypothetical protein IKS39_03750 [Clostridia bacterium]|nr:hypothetical protein [Clostridia bacterium]
MTRNPFTGRITEDLIGERKYVTYAEIDEMPAADVVEVKHGEWRCPDPKKHPTANYCTECGYMSLIRTNFCPNCGADMRERKEAE